MNQITKYIGLFAILPLALVTLSPNLVGYADADMASDVVSTTISSNPAILYTILGGIIIWGILRTLAQTSLTKLEKWAWLRSFYPVKVSI